MSWLHARSASVSAVVVTLLFSSGCTGVAPPGTSQPTPTEGTRFGRAAITAPAAWAGHLTVQAAPVTEPIVDDAQAWLAKGVMVGTPFEVTADQPLPPEGVVIARRYPAPLDAGMSATVAFFNETAQAWQAVPSDLSPDRTMVVARVNHLSIWTDFVSGSKEALAEFKEQAGGAIKAGAEFTKDTFEAVKNWSGERLAQAADWMFYAVGKVFDVRVEGPSCDPGAPAWVDTVVHIADDRNNSVRFCSGHDSKQPDLLVVKARVNRGFAFTATISPRLAWRYNSTDAKGLWDQVIPWLSPDQAMKDAVFEAAGGDPRLLVGAGEELGLGVTEAEVRKLRANEVLVLNPPTPLVFLSSLLAQLLMQDGMLKDESSLTATITLAACAVDVKKAKASDVLSIAKATLTCLQSRSDDIARLTAQAMGKAGRSPKASGAAAGLIARVSIYLALIGPVFSSMNYAAEKATSKDSRSVSVFSKTRKRTEVIDLNILDGTGNLKPGYALDDQSNSEPIDCSYDEGSPVARSGGTHSCGTVADNTFACWAVPDRSGDVYCLFNPWDKGVVRRSTTGLADTSAPAAPAPFAVELDDGTRWFYRVGGAWDAVPEGFYATYGPVGEYNNKVLVGRGDTHDFSIQDGVWTVLQAQTGSVPEGLPPPVPRVVSKVWFITAR